MVRFFCTCALLVAGIGTATGSQALQSSGSFSVVLERTGTRWSATCERGCEFQWGSTTTREAAMPMKLDAHGIRTLAADFHEPSPFAVTLVAKGRGWEATSVSGTAWTQLAFDCAQEPCRARMTDLGVMGITNGR